MKALLFCQNPYAFGILGPVSEQLAIRNDRLLWYVPERITSSYPFGDKYKLSSSVKDCYDFAPDVIFVPGNEVPHYLRGLKVQIFHGFAGEKKGHFRIRHYFDLYLTQGPWFTHRFKELSARHKDFSVIETGWSKLDPLFQGKSIKESSGAKKLVLYAPTFSPSLTSAHIALKSIIDISEKDNLHLIIKFHDLTSAEIIEKYKKAAKEHKGLEISEDKNILPLLISADIMISDTSSAVYEFLLLDKPVVTINSRSGNIKWDNISNPEGLEESVLRNLNNDPFVQERKWIRETYHPYYDGKSSLRMIEAAEDFIKVHGIPEQRKLPLLRKRKMNKMFGKKKNYV